jgi:hypothetical protein
MERKRHRLLSELSDFVTEMGIDFNLSPEQAEQLGRAVADFLATHFGGQNITFPRDYFQPVDTGYADLREVSR